MNTSYTANPRFDPQRNAAELGLRQIPIFFLDGAASAGSTDPTAVESPDPNGRIPWGRVAVVLLFFWAVWKLAR